MSKSHVSIMSNLLPMLYFLWGSVVATKEGIKKVAKFF